MLFSIQYILFSTLPSEKQVLYIIIFVLFFKPNLTAVSLGFSYFVHGSPSLNITEVHLGFSNFVDCSPPENLTAVHLAFSNFIHGGLSKNLTAVHLGFSNITHGCRACRHGIKLPQSYGKWMHLQRNITLECLLSPSIFNGEIIFHLKRRQKRLCYYK